jgi:predicted component of type VI protein secretion system
LEDVVVVVDGRPSLHHEMEATSTAVREFVAKNISELLSKRSFRDALPGHLPPDPGSQARLPLLLQHLQALAVLAA